MKTVSLFAGAGGLDLGFKNAGFDLIWANEFDKSILDTFRTNFPETELDDRSIAEVTSSDIPDSIGIIGGPPCQSWSEAGALRGIDDSRGQLFLEYVRILRDKQPTFFLAENVAGMLFNRHKKAFEHILRLFSEVGYNVSYKLINAKDFGVPQDRKRVIFVGFHKTLGLHFNFDEPPQKKMVLSDAIYELPDAAPALGKNKSNRESDLPIPNHEYMTGGFSTIYMSRTRVRSWDEPSFTIQAGGRHAPMHPKAPKMPKIGKDKHSLEPGSEDLYRRLSVRECARIQTFPDTFKFIYDSVSDGYKMVGNAVPVTFAEALAGMIKRQLETHLGPASSSLDDQEIRLQEYKSAISQEGIQLNLV